ncbi:MAG: class I SAM-dependent methyltransferase [Planctomycetaceae bacterium]|nr:class I SAM-dependent methyltransferase [Planctomycetaceae bacterium]
MAPETPGDTERSFYEATARHYDPAYAADRRLNDLAFWLELAGRRGGPILEVACGTGRVLLPIARSGVPIDGVDLSPEMLGVLKAKLAREPEEVRCRVALHEGDIRELRLGASLWPRHRPVPVAAAPAYGGRATAGIHLDRAPCRSRWVFCLQRVLSR